MAITKFLCSIALAITLGQSASAAPLPLHRGIGLHDWLNWAPLNPDGTYRQPPYHTISEWLSGYRPLAEWPAGNELERIKDFGFDFVRLSVDPGPLLANGGKDRAGALQVLKTDTEKLTTTGLKVVFNLHPVTQVEAFSPKAIEQGPDSLAIAAYDAMLADTARMLTTIGTDQVALEPYNEPGYYPCGPGGNPDWQAVQAGQIKAIRAVNQDLTIIATGACGGDIDDLSALDAKAFDDPNMLYSFHMYDPHSFTHQRLDNGWYSGLPWPANRLSEKTVEDALNARMSAAGVNFIAQQANWLQIGTDIHDYFATGWDRAAMATQFAAAVQWAKTNGIAPDRLFMGEFGVITMGDKGDSGALPEDRNRYLQAARELAESYGMAWAYWEYANPYGMTFIEPKGPTLPDAGLTAALGLPPAQ